MGGLFQHKKSFEKVGLYLSIYSNQVGCCTVHIINLIPERGTAAGKRLLGGGGWARPHDIQPR